MKTIEELNALKEEIETMNRKLAELNEEELKQVTGGSNDIEITFEYIMQYINAGNDRMAAEYFRLAQYSLAPFDAYQIRMAFWARFGYAIDMYEG